MLWSSTSKKPLATSSLGPSSFEPFLRDILHSLTLESFKQQQGFLPTVSSGDPVFTKVSILNLHRKDHEVALET